MADPNLKKVAHTFGLALVALLLGGCPTYIRPEHISDDPLVYLARLAARQDVVERAALEVTARVSSSILFADASAIVVARRPADLRVEVLSPTDDLLAILTADKSSFVHYERGAALCYTGPPCVENTSRLLPFPVEARDLVEILLGGAPLLVRGTPNMEWDAWSGLHTMTIRGAGGFVQHISFEPCLLRVARVEVFRDGVLQLRLIYRDWQMVSDVAIPKSLHMSFPEQNLDADLVVVAAEPRISVDNSAFRFVCPSGTERVVLPCPEN